MQSNIIKVRKFLFYIINRKLGVSYNCTLLPTKIRPEVKRVKRAGGQIP